jgi:hypothetical protein
VTEARSGRFEGDHRKRRSEKLGKGMVEEVQLGPEEELRVWSRRNQVSQWETIIM